MKEALRKNEMETNELVSRCIRYIVFFVLGIAILCGVGIFNISMEIVRNFLLASMVPLIIPSILVDGFHIDKGWVKYIVISCILLVTGIAYVAFTFQMVLVFILPTILATMYWDKKVFYFTVIETTLVILASHFISAIVVLQPWIEPFVGVGEVMLYGALSRILQYDVCSILLYLLNSRYTVFLQGFYSVMHEGEQSIDDKSKDVSLMREIEIVCEPLTKREREVFELLVRGYTNAEIAKHLYLSIGTVKNYVSIIYDKVGSKDRTALILRFGAYYRSHDQSHGESLRQ